MILIKHARDLVEFEKENMTKFCITPRPTLWKMFGYYNKLNHDEKHT